MNNLDPWLENSEQKVETCLNAFENNFNLKNNKFKPLEDSEMYLSHLECELSKITKSEVTTKSLVHSVTTKYKAALNELLLNDQQPRESLNLNQALHLDTPVNRNSFISQLIARVNPQQAIHFGELHRLLAEVDFSSGTDSDNIFEKMESAGKMSKPFWHRNTLLIITGASRGIGKCIAKEFAKLIGDNSVMILIARSLPNLELTKAEVLKEKPTIDVKTLSMDLFKPDVEEFKKMLEGVEGKFDLSMFVHNAASIIVDVPAVAMGDAKMWQDYLMTNVTSAAVLTTAFLQICAAGNRMLLNISSMAGIAPIKGLAFYCVSKAARIMYFKMIAEENPDINVLNYSPGPIETDMFFSVLEKCCNEEMKNNFVKLVETKTTVKMEDTLGKLVEILGRQRYDNGANIDYLDPISEIEDPIPEIENIKIA